MKKTCIIIAGPTAVGKTSVAISLARHFNTSIISADSRQCFRELNIGVAKPSSEQLELVKHHFIDSHSIHETVNAKVFEEYALISIDSEFEKHDVVVMTGGTGLYIKAFCDGLDEIPAVTSNVEEYVSSGYESGGVNWLQEQLSIHDPYYFKNGAILNPQRSMRALSVVLSSGNPIHFYQSGANKKRNFDIVKIGLELERSQLYENINHRVDEMMNCGLLREVEELNAFKSLPALRTVGYQELFPVVDGSCNLGFAVEEIKKNTRHYAKRQMTWFKKDESLKWFTPTAVSEIINYISAKI
ncbi:MAG: tRNA (adenosine(37)-N6)-dimethylallyltransferase MiaA [Ginsengibacter sp.]